MASQPCHVTRPGTRARSQSSMPSPSASSGSLRRPFSASSATLATVSDASFLFVPMTPLAPRLIQPTAYSPGIGRPSSVVTRPESLRISPRSSPKGQPGRGRAREARQGLAAVAEGAQDEATFDRLLLAGGHRAQAAGGVRLDAVADDAQAADRRVVGVFAEHLERRAQEP